MPSPSLFASQPAKPSLSLGINRKQIGKCLSLKTVSICCAIEIEGERIISRIIAASFR